MLNPRVKDAIPSDEYAGPHMAGVETMGDRISTLRKARGLTQQQLAERVGVTKGAVSHWENGATENIKLRTFQALLEILHTDAQYLIFGPDRESPAPSSSGRVRQLKA